MTLEQEITQFKQLVEEATSYMKRTQGLIDHLIDQEQEQEQQRKRLPNDEELSMMARFAMVNPTEPSDKSKQSLMIGW